MQTNQREVIIPSRCINLTSRVPLSIRASVNGYGVSQRINAKQIRANGCAIAASYRERRLVKMNTDASGIAWRDERFNGHNNGRRVATSVGVATPQAKRIAPVTNAEQADAIRRVVDGITRVAAIVADANVRNCGYAR